MNQAWLAFPVVSFEILSMLNLWRLNRQDNLKSNVQIFFSKKLKRLQTIWKQIGVWHLLVLCHCIMHSVTWLILIEVVRSNLHYIKTAFLIMVWSTSKCLERLFWCEKIAMSYNSFFLLVQLSFFTTTQNLMGFFLHLLSSSIMHPGSWRLWNDWTRDRISSVTMKVKMTAR